jgi:stage III sporulation protein SpoIIIAA
VSRVEIMAAEAIFIVGLPGCGKTTYLTHLESDGWEVFDDFKADSVDGSAEFRKAKKFNLLVSNLRAGIRCAVADVDFCRPASRQQAEGDIRAEVKIWRLSGASSNPT